MSKANAAAVKAAPEPTAAQTAADTVKQILTEALPPVRALLMQEWKAREAGVWLNTHEVVPPKGTPMEDLERPEFWGNISQRLRPGDTILAYPRDGAWYAEYFVWDAGQNYAHVRMKGGGKRPDLAAAPGVVNDFDITRDPIDGWTVVRVSTGVKLKSGFPNHEDARKWLIDHQRVMRT